MSDLLIGLSGFKGTGKNTVADYLCEKHGFQQAAFADKLKDAVCALFDISRERLEWLKNNRSHSKGSGIEDCVIVGYRSGFNMGGWVSYPTPIPQSMRVFLQRFGTEMGRDIFGQDFWLDQLLPPINWWAGKPTVITDTRFENELTRIKDLGGFNIRIVRPSFEGDGHASEVEPPAHLIDCVIRNEGSLDELYAAVETALDVVLRLHN